MPRPKGSRFPRIVITGFTIFAVLVSLGLAAMEPLRTAQYATEKADRGDGSLDRSIPFPQEEPALLTMEDPRLMPWRTGVQRIFMHGEPHKGALAFCQSPVTAALSIHRLDVKQTILLKLRI